MQRVNKEYLPEIDYCSFMLAIVLARHKIDEANLDQQCSAEDLSIEMNNLPWGNTANFGVNSIALKHGINLFSAGLRRSVSRITMFHKEKSLAPFFSLEGHIRSTEVKFSTYYCPPTRDVADLLLAIREIRDDLLNRSNYPASVHCSAAAVLGTLHFKPFKSPTDAETVRKRKSPDKLGQRMIDINRNKLINEIDKTFGEKHSIFYLESALKKAKKRGKRSGDNNNEVDENIVIKCEFDHIDHLALSEVSNDIRVKNVLMDLPVKNVIFDADDQKNVMLIYDVIKKVVEERDYTNVIYVAADITEELLKKNKYYSTISARTILRWSSVKSVNKKPGRKVNIDFEADVWGNLMLCMFEKNEDDAVSFEIEILITMYE